MCQKNPGFGHKKLQGRYFVHLDALLKRLQKVAEIAYMTSNLKWNESITFSHLLYLEKKHKGKHWYFFLLKTNWMIQWIQ